MRIKECRIGAFGHIHDFDLKDLDSDLVVVLGPNETGKSTLFEFLKTMIYGVYPTSPEQHDYAPWSGRHLEGSLSIELLDGSEQIVSRRLSKGPEGYILNGRRRNIRNQTIPAATHISRELFDSVYALTLSEMASIRERPWQEIEERLLGELKLDALRPVKSVIKELEDEASSLWRESNRGKPRAKELEKEIRELRKLARSAVVQDSETRRLQEELETIEAQLEGLRARNLELKSRQKWLEKILPCRKLAAKLEEARLRAGNEIELQDLPENPAARLEELHRAIGRFKETIAGKEARLIEQQEALDRFTDQDKKLVELTPEIREWASRSKSHRELLDRLAEAREELSDSERKAELVAARILPAGSKGEGFEAILTISEQELTEAVKGFTEAQASVNEVQNDISASNQSQSYLPSAFLSILGAGLCVVNLFRTSDILLATGLALFALGMAWLISVWLRKRRLDESMSRLLCESEQLLERNSGRIKELLSGFPLPENRLAQPDLFLVRDLANLKTAAERVRSKQTTLANLQRQTSKTSEDLKSWLEQLDLRQISEGFSAIKALERSLERAVKRQLQSEHAASAVAEFKESLVSLNEELESRVDELNRLESRLQQLGSGDIETGLNVLKSRREASRARAHFQKSLEEEYPDWESTQEEAKSLESQEIADQLAASRADLEQVGQQIEHLSAERMARTKDIQHLQSQRTSADLESEIAQLQSDAADIKFNRDRLLLLSRIIKQGDQRFRDRHQPDVLRRASEFLSLITGKRYVRLDLDKESQRLEVLPADQIHPVIVDRPLSQGVRDQIYLSLRLALVEHLDDAYEKLPLFLDEILVNWDESRRRQGYALLKRILSSRQVFVFTCHRWLAEEFISALGGKQVELSAS